MSKPYKRVDKIHYRTKENKLKSWCGKEPPQYKNLGFATWRKKVTCRQCRKKMKAFQNGKPPPLVRMHDDWVLAPPKNKREVKQAARRGVQAHRDIDAEVDRRINRLPARVS